MARFQVNREAGAVVLIFLAFYLALGLMMPYFPVWMAERGMTAAQISFVVSFPMLFRTFAAPVYGMIGDRFGQRKIVRAMTAISFAAAFALPYATGDWMLTVLTVLVYIGWQATPMQMDSIAVGLVRRGVVASYGSLRAFGSSAFVVASVTGGMVLSAYGSQGIITYFIFVAGLTVLATTLVPRTEVAPRTDQRPGTSVWRQPRVMAVLTAAALIHCSHIAVLAYGALYMRSLGFSDTLIGVILATAICSEIAMFAMGKRWSRLLGPISLMTLAAGVAVVRWCLFAFARDPATIFGLQLLHGVTFGFAYLGLIGFIAERVDPRYAARTQGVYVALFGGLQAAMALAVGQVFDELAGLSFLIASIPPALAVAILLAWRFTAAPTVEAGPESA